MMNPVLIKKFGRSKVHRHFKGDARLGATPNSSFLDLLMPSQNKGLPIATINHSIDTQTILLLSAGVLAAGVLIKHL